MIYLISYALNRSDKDYSQLINKLKSYETWWHYLDSTWLISTNKDAENIYKDLMPFLDEDDSILIINVGKDRQGWLPKKAWEWIHKHLKEED